MYFWVVLTVYNTNLINRYFQTFSFKKLTQNNSHSDAQQKQIQNIHNHMFTNEKVTNKSLDSEDKFISISQTFKISIGYFFILEVKNEFLYYAVVTKPEQTTLYFQDALQYDIYRSYVLPEYYQGVCFPAGLKNIVKPVIDSVDRTFKPAFIHGKARSIQIVLRDESLPLTGEPKTTHDHSRKRKPATKHFSSNPYDSILAYYESINDTIGISLLFSYNPFDNVSGLEHNVISALINNPAFYTFLCKAFNLNHENKRKRSGNRSYLASVLMELFSGTNQYNTWRNGKTKLQQLVKNHIAPNLNTSLKPTNDQLWHYSSSLAHESHHREFKIRTLKTNLFSSEEEYNNLDSIIHYYDSRYEIELNPQFVEQINDPFTLQRIANRKALTVLSSHIHSPEVLHDLIKMSVVTGCDEVIAQILQRTIAMNCSRIRINTNLSDLYGSYSPFHYVYPSIHWISQWEERLLCEYPNLGDALNDLYTDLFEGQQLRRIIQETTDSLLKKQYLIVD